MWLEDIASGNLVFDSIDAGDVEFRHLCDRALVIGSARMQARYTKGDYNGEFRYMGVYTKDSGDWRLVLTSAERVEAAYAGAIITFADTRIHSPFTKTIQKETVVSNNASGTFEVKLNPQDDKEGDPTISRMSLDKQFHGDLEAASKGQMLAAGTDVQGSAGYVAIERLNGKLQGRTGTFALQHSGTMTRGVPQLTVTVVPDSGTDQLIGLAGYMTINIVDGKHFYDFEYTLAQSG